jgi:hypothetical protein
LTGYKTEPDISNQYYVYKHIDPETKEILYIGMGYGPRAYTTNCSGIRGDRSKEHSLKLHQLMNEGYLPHEWVEFPIRNATIEIARTLENKYIKEFNPVFNKKHGPKRLITDRNDIEKILTLRDEGISYLKIGKMYDVSWSTIQKLEWRERGKGESRK